MASLDGFHVLTLSLDNGEYAPVNWSDKPFSKAECRRAYRRFKGDGDVISACSCPASRLFDTRSEMIKYFGRSK